MGGDERGYDVGKKIKGRKKIILVDTLVLLLATKVVSASVSEKTGVQLLLTNILITTWLMKLCKKIKLIWADYGYQVGQPMRRRFSKLLSWT